MTKSKSPKKASPLSNGTSINTANHLTKQSIAAAGAALQAATASTPDSRASPPPSPRQLKHTKETNGSTPPSKEVKDHHPLHHLYNDNNTHNNVGLQGQPAEATAVSVAALIDSASSSNSNDQPDVGQDWKHVRSSSSTSFFSGSGSGNGGLAGANGSSSLSTSFTSSRTPLLSPSASSNRNYNLFERLQQHQQQQDPGSSINCQHSGGEDVGSSDSSNNSEDLDDQEEDESSESDNSSHASDDEDSTEEEDEVDEEDSDEEDEASTKDTLSAAQKAGKRKEHQRQQRSGSPLLRRTLNKKHIQRIRDEQHFQPQRKSDPSSPKGVSSLANHNYNYNDSSLSIAGNGSGKEGVVLLADETARAKWRNWSVRTLWTLIMIGGFFACLAAGPAWVILLVVMVQGLVYKEVIYLANVPSKEKKLPWFRSLNWYFLFSTNYFFYGESLIHYFQHVVFVDAFLLPFATHHRFISFTLYVIGFVFFVANLKKGHYRFQFSQFAWTHMTLLLVVCQSHFIINNIFEGLIWFFLPATLVIANDIWAYIFGFFFGKTPLIKLSPKKTVEGFVGGWIMTIVFGMLFATLFIKFPYMICPVKDLRTTAFSGLTCDPNPVFIPVRYNLKPWMYGLVRHLGMDNYVLIAPLQLHTIFMACFASLIAPFGGFFASGFKRAFKIKDFGQSIPGHGGITDRMDCQFLMGLFSYMYYQSFIKTSAISVGFVLQSAIHNLKGPEQMELFDHMRQYLIGQGLLDQDSCVIIPPKEAWIS